MADHGYFEELIAAAVDGELPRSEEAELRAHLEECPECRAFYEAMRAVSGVTAKHLPPPPADFTARVMDAVRTAPAGKKKGIIPFPKRTLAVAAAAALVLWAGVSLGNLRMGSSSANNAPRSNETMNMSAAADQAAPQESGDYNEMPEIRLSDAPAGGVEAPAAPTEDTAGEEETVMETELEGAAAVEVRYLLYAGEDTDAAPLVESTDADFWEMVLTFDKAAEPPPRAADYTLLRCSGQGGPAPFRLWDVDGVIIVELPNGQAGYTVNARVLAEQMESIP